MKLFLTVLLAHLVGDFPLQSLSMVRAKHQGIRAYLVHGAIHLLILVLCMAAFISLELFTSLWFWMAVCLYIAIHLGIDRAKQGLVNTAKLADSATVFLLDQVLHSLHHYRARMVPDTADLGNFEIPTQLVYSDRR